MPLSTNHRKLRHQGIRPTDTRLPTTPSNLSYQANPHAYPGLESGIDLSSVGGNSSECSSCLGEPNPAVGCRFPANAGENQYLSGCMDPSCTETVCDECSDHEECCHDCGVDCESDCGVPFGCDGFHIGVDDTYACENSYSELFGDQTAQTFGFGSPLPQLTTDNTTVEPNDFVEIPNDATLSTLPDYSMDQTCSTSILQPNLFSQMPWTFNRQYTSPQATTASRPSYISTYHGLPSHGHTCANVSPRQMVSPMQFSESAHGSLDPTDTTANAHYDHVSLPSEQTGSARHVHPNLRCQWAGSDGRPCGETLKMGEDMHEHLKSAHGVKGEVFCRWVGCCVGISTASPHRFASSVERHTWGHSGYRPYKCRACNEGFAAASVRDEHVTNIHERKKVFACDMCSHQCTSATNLKRHKDDKHSAERFQCEFCNRNGKRRLFPRGPNLARHLRTCKYVLARFPEAAAAGKTKADWLPPGYRRGHHGMDRAKVTPPNYLPVLHNA